MIKLIWAVQNFRTRKPTHRSEISTSRHLFPREKGNFVFRYHLQFWNKNDKEIKKTNDIVCCINDLIVNIQIIVGVEGGELVEAMR